MSTMSMGCLSTKPQQRVSSCVLQERSDHSCCPELSLPAPRGLVSDVVQKGINYIIIAWSLQSDCGF